MPGGPQNPLVHDAAVRQRFMDLIRSGSGRYAAAAGVGLSPDQYRYAFKNSPEFLEAVQGGKLKVVGAVCDISTGKVEWLGEHPWQQELIDALGGVATAEKDEGHK